MQGHFFDLRYVLSFGLGGELRTSNCKK